MFHSIATHTNLHSFVDFCNQIRSQLLHVAICVMKIQSISFVTLTNKTINNLTPISISGKRVQLVVFSFFLFFFFFFFTCEKKQK
jgi:hypothetical protein